MKFNQFVFAVSFACSLLFAFPWLAFSQESEALPLPSVPAEEFYARISGYQPSFIGWEIGAEPHVDFQISIQYPFLPFVAFGANTDAAFFGYQSGFYVAYTGRFDLLLQRDSAPLISRDQNPGMFFSFNRCFDQPLILTVGYFHESNGQAINTRAKYLAIADHPQDFVSRGWDYVLLGTEYSIPWQVRSNQDQSKLTFRAEGLYFLEKQGFGTAWKEENIFWEDVSWQPQRSDFDGIRVSMVLQNPNYRLADTLRSGYNSIRLTNDLTFTYRIGKWLPVSIQWHRGYGPDLSTYHVFSQHLTLGFELYDLMTR